MKAIYTANVNCRDCHKCVRICPVKAIGIVNGHATLVENSCIYCGRCVQECPRGAKRILNQMEEITKAKVQGKKIVLSLAPSFISAFPEYSYLQLVKLLHRAGFDAVQETAIGAEIVSFAYKRELEDCDKTLISACCPVAVNLIEKYFPTLVENISPTRSPMVVHGGMLKEKYGQDAFVVFAGPCIGKFYEAKEFPEAIDLVITFEQLNEMLERVKYALDDPNEPLKEREAYANARYFPIRGGIIKSFMDSEETDVDVFSVNGIEECMEVFDNVARGEIKPRFLEAMACLGGCISGPGMLHGRGKCRPVNRKNVIRFASLSYTRPDDLSYMLPKVRRKFTARGIDLPMPSPEEIRVILSKIGKNSQEDEKNCGACGYNTCRDKAIATFQGLAEPDMCIPYMRTKAESLSNLVVDNSMDAIVVIDNDLIVQDFNQMAQAYFRVTKQEMLGRSLSRVIECNDIIEAIAENGKREVLGKSYEGYNFAFDVRIMPIIEHELAIVIFKDVTDIEQQKKELLDMKVNTIEKANSIIHKQMSVAQEIAGLLGETTAETKSALLELVKVLNAKGDK